MRLLGKVRERQGGKWADLRDEIQILRGYGGVRVGKGDGGGRERNEG
jgi:hypothetical protein